MSQNVSWRGTPFWFQTNDRRGRFKELQASLCRRNIFATNDLPNLIDPSVQPRDIIPVPHLYLDDRDPVDHAGDNPFIKETYCAPLKTSAELLAMLPLCRRDTPLATLLDQRIEELKQNIPYDLVGLAASPKILANLRPELPPQRSSIVHETGVSRLPNELLKKILGHIHFRRDMSSVSLVSKRWREQTLPVLYSTLVLRGWDEVILCLTTVHSVQGVASFVKDLTIDIAHLPESLEPLFCFTLEHALDATRRLRRLALLMPIDKRIVPHMIFIFEQCRFRLYDFVYEGSQELDCLTGFLNLQALVRTLQIPHIDVSDRTIFTDMLPNVTQAWISFPVRGYIASWELYRNMKNLTHLSHRGQVLPQFRKADYPSIHYLACDISAWVNSNVTVPLSLRLAIHVNFSALRILRLVGCWLICETPADAPAPLVVTPPVLAPPAFTTEAPTNDEPHATIGDYLDGTGDDTNAPTLITPNLCIEPTLLKILSDIPGLQALEVGGFVVRDAGRLRTKPGHAKRWITRRMDWEEEFINRITSKAAKNLVVVSFLSCDEPLYNSANDGWVAHCGWKDYLERVKRRITKDDAESGVTLSDLVFMAGVTRWHGGESQPHIDPTFEPPASRRQLSEEVITSEWAKVGDGGTWIRRVNVRNLRDIWPPGC